MCLRLVFLLITRIAAWLRLARREETWKTAEILLLRHQLAVLQRQQPHRRKRNWADRALMASLLSVIRRAASGGSRRAARSLVRAATGRVGPAHAHRFPAPVSSRLDRQRHLARAAQPQAPSGRHHERAPAVARSARVFTDASGTRRSPPSSLDRQPPRHCARTICATPRCLYGWLPAPLPAEIAARAGHSVHVLLTTYAHGLPGYGQIASRGIDRALHASTGPPPAHKSGLHPARSRPSCGRVTAGFDGTQRDLDDAQDPSRDP
jgi:hypothetical protein